LKNAINKKINFTDKTTGKEYKLNEKHAVLIVRPRGWHLDEAHFLVDNEKCSGGIFDFGIYFYHNAKQLLQNGTGPLFLSTKNGQVILKLDFGTMYLQRHKKN
jgi:malate synthase